ncbi:hypothetical protein C4564_04740 [Candidatus Microgenomates bacterium]|nr:MAG: hypothetical protein C4564_04740 [Candidatus Microgenomates bacterium]
MDIVGGVKPPAAIARFKPIEGGAIGQLLTMFVNLLIVGAGIYAVINFILAGYAFMSAGDDPKQIQGAWAKIYQTIIGLAVVAGSMVLAAIFGYLFYGSWDAILSPVIPTLR